MKRPVGAWQSLRRTFAMAVVSVCTPQVLVAEPVEALPPLVMQTLKKEWAAMSVVSVRKEERNDYVHYHVLLRGKTGERKIEVLENGTVVKDEPVPPPKR